MNIGALLELGVELEYLKQELSKLQLDEEYELQITKSTKKGISGTRVDVKVKSAEEEHRHEHKHCSDFLHSHRSEHKHTEQGNLTAEKVKPIHTALEHRNLRNIENIIEASSLNSKVKKISKQIFQSLGEAEAKVHGKALYEVHFHEVGATDSIIDIVGAAICLDYLKVDKIMCSTVQLGGGFVNCAHGIIPIPAPATVELLQGIPVKLGLVQFETTTPTGAAILAANVEEFTDSTKFSIIKTGYGIGHRDLNIPNVLRVYLGTAIKLEQREIQYILETNIDDMNPELYSYVEEQLFAHGALDVFKTAILMKKGRPAIRLSILIEERQEEAILEIIFKETTSTGVRKFPVEKIMLKRELKRLKTVYGEVTIKYSYYRGKLVNCKPEYEDCRQIASKNGIPLLTVYQEVQKEINLQGLEHEKIGSFEGIIQ